MSWKRMPGSTVRASSIASRAIFSVGWSFASLLASARSSMAQAPRTFQRSAFEALVASARWEFVFFVAIGGRHVNAHRLEALGHTFERGQWVLLDLYGTDHHPRIWPDPARFDPDRFPKKLASPFELVPQGAGDPVVTHRCPGEDLALALMTAAVQQLVALTFDVPEQD